MAKVSKSKRLLNVPSKTYRKSESLNCPECGSSDTVSEHSSMKGGFRVQKRICRNLACRKAFKIILK